jgi:hypothetical protein
MAISGVEIDQGWWTGNFARQIEVAVSDEGREWRPVWSGVTALQVMRAALANPRQLRLEMPFPPSRGRHVRLRQTATGGGAPWIVADVRVFGTAIPP